MLFPWVGHQRTNPSCIWTPSLQILIGFACIFLPRFLFSPLSSVFLIRKINLHICIIDSLISPPRPLFFTGNLTLTRTNNHSFSNPKPRQFHSLDMPQFKPRIQLVWTIIIPENTTKTLLSPCLIFSSIMDLYLVFSSRFVFNREYIRKDRELE